ncbi:uncharacterized protein G2W53_001415 [Senna tora]|uniref:Transmembrane protein n=1 Tax=Senna tora TaxID=362788 RepID=A0A834XFI1_9FABA|nr:uncharacterized protein G2W53_001415 [Senna tora]
MRDTAFSATRHFRMDKNFASRGVSSFFFLVTFNRYFVCSHFGIAVVCLFCSTIFQDSFTTFMFSIGFFLTLIEFPQLSLQVFFVFLPSVFAILYFRSMVHSLVPMDGPRMRVEGLDVSESFKDIHPIPRRSLRRRLVLDEEGPSPFGTTPGDTISVHNSRVEILEATQSEEREISSVVLSDRDQPLLAFSRM